MSYSGLRKSKEKAIAGVCAGIAENMGYSIVIVRLLFLLLFFLTAGTASILYIILWIIMPESY